MKIKGFDKDLKCRGFQFEVGKDYFIDTKGRDLELCTDTVFHYCDSLQKVHQFYDITIDNRFCEIEVLGEEVSDNEKCGSNHIRIVREIVGEELDIIKGLINGNTGIFNSGYYNSGDYNSGYYNSGYYNSGFFCTEKDSFVTLFDEVTNIRFSKFFVSEWYYALQSTPFMLMEWIVYTEEEKEADTDKALIGGYLKTYTYKEACRNWWDTKTEKDKEIIKTMPNFNPAKFKEITGIDV
jgi:hypothetical protein